MQRKNVDSSSIKSVGHTEKDGLEIEFTSNAVYRYPTVPASVYQALLQAESVGKFFGANIRPKFKGVEVQPR